MPIAVYSTYIADLISCGVSSSCFASLACTWTYKRRRSCMHYNTRARRVSWQATTFTHSCFLFSFLPRSYDADVAVPCPYPCPCPCFRFHSSGVKHLGVQACMAAISALRAALTRRCRARVVFLSKSGETILASKD